MAQTALAERYRDLGFRVVEGGKSNKLAVLKTPAVGEIFGKRHDNVLGDVREYQERLPSNLRAVFSEHCRPATYVGKDRSGVRDCFELTKVGFSTVAAKYDPALCFLLALAFDALECADDGAQASVLGQINKRISELRSQATGQNELIVHVRHEPLPKPDDKCERRELAREQERSRKTVEQLRLFGAQGRFAFKPPAETIADEGKDDYGWHDGPQQALKPGAFAREAWTDEENGVVCQIMRRNDVDGDPWMLFFVRAGSEIFIPTELLVVDPRGNGKQIHIRLNHITPLAVVLRAYERMGRGPLSDIALATLRHFLAF